MTEDPYGASYWDALDSGRGYTDSVMWSDIAHILHEFFAMDHKTGQDRCGQTPHVDVGCASGYLVLNMRKRGFESFGLDFSRYALSVAPLQIAEYLKWFDLTGTEHSFFGRTRFKLLTCFETLEHLPEEHARQALQHLWDLLVPGGTGVLTICVAGQPDSDRDPTHVNVRERAWWAEQLKRVGFSEDTKMLAQLQWFHLFNQHKGVFILHKSSGAAY